jgi:HSP20 family protein
MVKKDTKKKIEKVPINKENEDELTITDSQYRRYWQSFDIMHQFEHEIDEVFRDLKSRYYFPSRFRDVGGYRFPVIRQSLVDIESTDKNLIVTSEIPGISNENVDINVTENSIEISTKVHVEFENKEKDYYHHERSYKSYYRSLPLPQRLTIKKQMQN